MNTAILVAVDAFGDTIQVGDTIIYARRSGSAMWFVKGKVIDLDGKRIRVQKESSTESYGGPTLYSDTAVWLNDGRNAVIIR